WAQGAFTLHGVFTHGFPNLCMNSHIQGGQHINFAYTLAKAGQHTAWVIRQALDAKVTVQPEVDAEEAWFQTCLATVDAYATYFATCTPGYLNGEAQMPEERNSRSLCYMFSAVEFSKILADWRAEGSMKGLVTTPVRS